MDPNVATEDANREQLDMRPCRRTRQNRPGSSEASAGDDGHQHRVDPDASRAYI